MFYWIYVTFSAFSTFLSLYRLIRCVYFMLRFSRSIIFLTSILSVYLSYFSYYLDVNYFNLLCWFLEQSDKGLYIHRCLSSNHLIPSGFLIIKSTIIYCLMPTLLISGLRTPNLFLNTVNIFHLL